MTPATVLRRAAARVRRGEYSIADAIWVEGEEWLFECIPLLPLEKPRPQTDEGCALLMEAAADAWEAANPGKVEAP